MKFSSRLAQRECVREIDGSGRERARQKGMQQTGNTNLFFTIARTARIGHFLFIAKLVGRHFHAAIAIRRTHSHCHSHTHAHTLNGIYIDILSAVLYRRQRSQCEQCSAVQRLHFPSSACTWVRCSDVCVCVCFSVWFGQSVSQSLGQPKNGANFRRISSSSRGRGSDTGRGCSSTWHCHGHGQFRL